MWKCEFDLKSPEKKNKSIFQLCLLTYPSLLTMAQGLQILWTYYLAGVWTIWVGFTGCFYNFAYIGIEPAESLESSSVREKTGGEFL